MKKENRIQQVTKMVHTALGNLFQNQSEVNLDQFSVIVLEALMLLEREEYLKSYEGKSDSANGSYPRTFKSLRKSSMQINIPRSRKGQFKPITLELIKQQKEQVNNLSLLLYRKGLSTRDVSKVLEEFFGESISRETVNNLAENFQSLRDAWEGRKLDAYYKVIYCDALFVNLKRGNSYSKEAVYVIYGVKEDNTRELLLLEVNPTESSGVWAEYLAKLRKRGVEQIDLIVADGLPHFAEEAKKHYPEADIQRCVVHLERNILNKIRPRDKAQFASDLKQVFNNFESTSTKEQAMEKVKKIKSDWGGMYSKVLNRLSEEKLRDYLTYIDYPVEVRRMIYTTNSIENLNRQIRKVTKTKICFGNENNLLSLVFMVVKDFEASNWQKYPVTTFRYWPSFTHKD